jgi:hypothetical protein
MFCCKYCIKAMAEQENDIVKLEDLFPPASGNAFAAARDHVLQSGQSVLQSEDGCIYEVFPNGDKRFVKRIEPPVTVRVGQKITIR